MNPLILALLVSSAVDYSSLEINPDPTQTRVHENGVMMYGVIDGPCATLDVLEDHLAFHGLSYFDQHLALPTVTYAFMSEPRDHTELWARVVPEDVACLTAIYLRDETLGEFARRQRAGDL